MVANGDYNVGTIVHKSVGKGFYCVNMAFTVININVIKLAMCGCWSDKQTMGFIMVNQGCISQLYMSPVAYNEPYIIPKAFTFHTIQLGKAKPSTVDECCIPAYNRNNTSMPPFQCHDNMKSDIYSSVPLHH